MSFTTLFDVKKYGEYEHIVSSAPTTAEKFPDYLEGDLWLDSSTGYSYLLDDDTLGTWVRTDKAKDNKINLILDKTESVVFQYLQNKFWIKRRAQYTGDTYGYWNRAETLKFLKNECLFADYVFDAAAKTLTVGLKLYGEPTDWQPGDKIYVEGSKRNDGFYTIAAVDEATGLITVTETIKDEDSEGVFVYLVDIPDTVFDIVGRMVYYDVNERTSMGLKSEKVGTYSFTLGDMQIGGIGYPVEIVSGLDQFSGVTIGGDSNHGPL